MSSSSIVNNVAAPRQVACGTSDNDEIQVDLNVLRGSGTFKRMYDDLGLEEHDKFPGIFPVKTISTRIFKKVIEWCREHKDDPEPVTEKDPLTQEVKWLTFTVFENRYFFDVPVPDLLELVEAANFLDIPRLYQYACQSIAARIEGESLGEICKMLRQDCELSQARLRKIRAENPWFSSDFSGERIKNPVFIPNEVLVTIFEKLPRKDLESLQHVSNQFDAVAASSSPLHVVTKLEFGAYAGRSREICLWLHDDTWVTFPDYKSLAKRLKCSVVQKMRVEYHCVGIKDLTALLPVKSAWKNATVEAVFPYGALCRFAFTQLLFCKEIVLGRERDAAFHWSRSYMRLPAIAECHKLDISGLDLFTDHIQPADVVEWLEHELPPEKKWSEPRQLILPERTIHDGIDGVLTALKTAFLASSRPMPYVVRILRNFPYRQMDELLANETTHEALIIRAEGYGEIRVKRA